MSHVNRASRSLSLLAKIARCSSSALPTSAKAVSIAEPLLLPLVSTSSLDPSSLLSHWSRPKALQQRSISSTTFASSANNDKDEEEAFRELADAFNSLITGAYELMAEGKPAEAEMLLRKGAQQAEETLGAGSIQVVPLWDQLSLFLFMHDRCEEAVEIAQRAWHAVRDFAKQEGSPQARGAAATAAIRHASALIGSGQPELAAEQLGTAIADLDMAIAAIEPLAQDTNAATAEEAQQYLEKFKTAKGEGQFYSTLCALGAISNPTPDDVDSFNGGMEEALRTMTQYLGPRHPLTACALREHNRLTESAVDSERGPLAEALYFQEIRLHQAFDPDGEQTAALYYQLGTLQYCNGRHDHAIRSIERALRVLEHEFEGAEEHLFTVKHRLGMALGASGKHAHARDIFKNIRPEITDRLGDDNPISNELDFMTALMDLRDLRSGGKGKVKRSEDELFKEMERALKGLHKFGEEHMLVKYAQQQYDEAKK